MNKKKRFRRPPPLSPRLLFPPGKWLNLHNHATCGQTSKLIVFPFSISIIVRYQYMRYLFSSSWALMRYHHFLFRQLLIYIKSSMLISWSVDQPETPLSLFLTNLNPPFSNPGSAPAACMDTTHSPDVDKNHSRGAFYACVWPTYSKMWTIWKPPLVFVS